MRSLSLAALLILVLVATTVDLGSGQEIQEQLDPEEKEEVKEVLISTLICLGTLY